MNRFLLSLVFAILCTACVTGVSEKKEAEKIAKDIAGQFVPDSREDHFEVAFSASGSWIIAKGETTSPEARTALLEALVNHKIGVTDSVRILPDSSLGSKSWGLVTVSVCNIRSKPGHSSEMSTQAILGTPVRILKKSGSWIYVQTPDRYLGWVDDDAVFQTDSAGMAAWRGSKRVIYLPLSGTGMNPETGEAVTDLVAGSILKLGETSVKGLSLEMPDGRKLNIPAGEAMDFDLWKSKSNPSFETISRCAKSLAGRPYLWGGTSSKGVDCSGFVKTVYFLNGIVLARDASLQFRHGGFTDPQAGYRQLKPGDLVFFGRKAEGDRPAKATHVGIYLQDGAYINSSGYVRIDSFDPTQKNFSQVRADHWLGGRTILGSEGIKGIVRVRDHPWY